MPLLSISAPLWASRPATCSSVERTSICELHNDCKGPFARLCKAHFLRITAISTSRRSRPSARWTSICAWRSALSPTWTFFLQVHTLAPSAGGADSGPSLQARSDQATKMKADIHIRLKSRCSLYCRKAVVSPLLPLPLGLDAALALGRSQPKASLVVRHVGRQADSRCACESFALSGFSGHSSPIGSKPSCCAFRRWQCADCGLCKIWFSVPGRALNSLHWIIELGRQSLGGNFCS